MYDKADGGSGSGGGTNIPPTADPVHGEGQTIEIEGVDGENARPVDAKTVAAENDEGYNGGDENLRNADQTDSVKLVPATNEIRDILQNVGLDQQLIDKIVTMPKKHKPKVEEYLSKEYIDKHLQEFSAGGIVKIIPSEPSGTIGRRGGIFVLSEIELNRIIKNARGNISKIEQALGFDPGYLGKKPVVIKFNQVTGLRMPQGNELGADPKYWMPGGYTSGGIKEAVIDPAPEGTYSYYYLEEK